LRHAGLGIDERPLSEQEQRGPEKRRLQEPSHFSFPPSGLRAFTIVTMNQAKKAAAEKRNRRNPDVAVWGIAPNPRSASQPFGRCTGTGRGVHTVPGARVGVRSTATRLVKLDTRWWARAIATTSRRTSTFWSCRPGSERTSISAPILRRAQTR